MLLSDDDKLTSKNEIKFHDNKARFNTFGCPERNSLLGTDMDMTTSASTENQSLAKQSALKESEKKTGFFDDLLLSDCEERETVVVNNQINQDDCDDLANCRSMFSKVFKI